MGYSEAIESQFSTLRRESERWRYTAGEDRDSFAPVESALLRGDAYAVAVPICEMLAGAARSLPTSTLSRELLPSPLGWCYFERKFPMPDMTSEGYHPELRALTWTLFRDGIVVGVFMERSLDGRPWPTLHMNYPWLFGTNVLEVATEGPLPEPISGFTEYSAYLMTLLLFMHQRILVTSSRYIGERQTRKRLAKQLGYEPVVKVVELRRREYQQRDESHEVPVEWSCQWLVRGHWRQQFFPSTGEHRPLWIAPHVKGPSDKPLKAPTITAYEVVR